MEKNIEDILVNEETPAILKVIKEKMPVTGNYSVVKKEFYRLLKYYTSKKPEDLPSYTQNNINKQILNVCKESNIIYNLSFDTSEFKSNSYKDWEYQLLNDTIVKLNGVNWSYKTIQGLESRFEEIQGHGDKVTKENFILSDNSNNGYGKQIVRKALPGICSGYVSWLKVWDKLESSENKEVKIPFSDFYDIRALSKKINLKVCYVVIKKD